MIFSSCAFLHSTPTASCTGISPPLHVITTRAREGGPKEHRAKQKWPCETHIVTYAPGLTTHSYLLCIVAQPPPSLLCWPRPPSHHPYSLTSVYLICTLQLLPPSTPFLLYGTHPFIPHAQTISIISDPLYSQTPFLFQLSYVPLNS